MKWDSIRNGGNNQIFLWLLIPAPSSNISVSNLPCRMVHGIYGDKNEWPGKFPRSYDCGQGGGLGGWSFPLGCGAPVDFMEEQFCLASEKSANIYDEGSEMFLLLQAG